MCETSTITDVEFLKLNDNHLPHDALTSSNQWYEYMNIALQNHGH